MIWHPLLIAVIVGDLLSLLLWLGAAATAFQIVIKWVPHSAGREQIQLERRAETARLAAKFSLAVFFLSTALFIIGITPVLPAIVPGAMCGTGVLQATDGLVGPALIFRFFVFFIMMLWLTYEKLNLSRPDAPLTRYNSRILLLALPFFCGCRHPDVSGHPSYRFSPAEWIAAQWFMISSAILQQPDKLPGYPTRFGSGSSGC